MTVENNFSDSPIILKTSFNKLIEKYEELAKSDDEFIVANANRVLKTQAAVPILREGFEDFSLLEKYKNEINIILQDLFSSVLTNNEIKTASVPFEPIIFNSSERFKSIVKDAGENFELEIKNMPKEDRYIIACTLILAFHYGYELNYKRPFFYEIPDSKGIMRYYKILYNADFVEIIPTENAKQITKEDFYELLDNYENLELWKEKFPPNSYVFKGFVISNLFDVTDDQSISNIKSSLIKGEKGTDDKLIEGFYEVFRSLLGLKNIKVGFSIYNKEDDAFERVYGQGINSYIINNLESAKCEDSLCKWTYKRLLQEHKYISVSDVDHLYEKSQGKAPHIKTLYNQGIKSAIIAPIANETGLMGVLEIVSEEPKILNSINANKLADVMPFLVSSIERSKKDEENRIEAIIQKECTSIHPSVHWRFKKEAREFIKDEINGKDPNFNQIIFEDVYPLYGQIDIKGSSEARNIAIKKDLTEQLVAAKYILMLVAKQNILPIYEQFVYQINECLSALEENFQVDSEQKISKFLAQEIHPMFELLSSNSEVKELIESYNNNLDIKVKSVYKHRKEYDESVNLINTEMAHLLDKKQIEAQKMYPHYFERFKTDGVEHNMYIGESITKEKSFNASYLHNLRLWQLQMMIEMEQEYYLMQSNFPVKLDVASMLLVFNQPLSISFRMDEKQFDVDGTYNARYEIVKKRVDKAFIKGTDERVTQKGKITIIYSQRVDEVEYLNYVKFLQAKKYLGESEIVELQDLQAVTGLKAIRANILYKKPNSDKEYYSYEELVKELKA